MQERPIPVVIKSLMHQNFTRPLQELQQELVHLLIRILAMQDRGDILVRVRHRRKVSLPLVRKISMYLQQVTLLSLLLVLTILNFKTVEFPLLTATQKRTLTSTKN